MESLQFFEYAGAAVVDLLDLGTVAPSSSDDSQYFVYNNSDVYQASDVTVTTTTISGQVSDQLFLSLDGEAFATSIDLGQVPPNGSSLPFWLRRVTPSTADLGQQSAFLSALPGSWTAPVDTSADDDVALETPDEE